MIALTPSWCDAEGAFNIIIPVIRLLVKIIPGSFSTSWEVYSLGSLLGAHRLIKHHDHLCPHPSPHLYSWVKRSNSWFNLMLKCRNQHWSGLKLTFWQQSHENTSPVCYTDLAKTFTGRLFNDINLKKGKILLEAFSLTLPIRYLSFVKRSIRELAWWYLTENPGLPTGRFSCHTPSSLV